MTPGTVIPTPAPTHVISMPAGQRNLHAPSRQAEPAPPNAAARFPPGFLPFGHDVAAFEAPLSNAGEGPGVRRTPGP